MKIKKLETILKGQKAENNYGIITIQYKREASIIAQLGYCFVNCNSAYKNQARIDYVENGNFQSTNVIDRNKALWFIKVKFLGFDKNLEKAGFKTGDILNNLVTNGYTGQYICIQIQKGNKPKEEKVKNMKIAILRHTTTNYDLCDKKGLDDCQVRELRRYINSKIKI